MVFGWAKHKLLSDGKGSGRFSSRRSRVMKRSFLQAILRSSTEKLPPRLKYYNPLLLHEFIFSRLEEEIAKKIALPPTQNLNMGVGTKTQIRKGAARLGEKIEESRLIPEYITRNQMLPSTHLVIFKRGMSERKVLHTNPHFGSRSCSQRELFAMLIFLLPWRVNLSMKGKWTRVDRKGAAAGKY